MRLLPPDDAADVIQEAPTEKREALLALLDEPTRREVTALLAYAEDDAGGLMNPRFARLRPDMTVDEAISYLRKQMREQPRPSTTPTCSTPSSACWAWSRSASCSRRRRGRASRDIMRARSRPSPEQMDQEAVSHSFAQNHLVALPVVDAEGRMKGIVTVDDIVDVVQEEATEDMQKLGGVEALDAPYLQIELRADDQQARRLAVALFLGEMLTATAMGFFENEIARAVVLALFVPLIISSGGNSGSQATTLVIRAMALGEVRLRDWWRVIRREFIAGIALGAGAGDHRLPAHRHLGACCSTPTANTTWASPPPSPCSLVGVVLWGTMAGLDAAVHPAPAGLRPRQRVGAVRGDAGRRQRARHLLHGGGDDPAGDTALTRALPLALALHAARWPSP